MNHPQPVGTPGRRRGPSKGDLKEAAILDTAWRLLAEKPLAAITVEDLARGARISRSSFYFYFDSKDAVLLALAARITTEIRATSTEFFAAAGAVPDLRKGIAAYLDRWRERGAVLRAASALAESDGALRDFWSRVTGELLDEAALTIERLRQDGKAAPAPPDARDLAGVLFSMLWRTGYETSLAPPSPEEEQRLIDTLAAVFQRSLGLER